MSQASQKEDQIMEKGHRGLRYKQKGDSYKKTAVFPRNAAKAFIS